MSFNPSKPRAPGSTKAVVSALYHQAGGVKRAAALIERSMTVTYSYADQAEPSEISFDMVRKIAAFTGATAAAEDLAGIAGGVFLPCPASNRTFDALNAETAEQWGAYTALLLRAHAAGALETLEPRIRSTLDSIIRALAAARAQLIAIEAGGK